MKKKLRALLALLCTLAMLLTCASALTVEQAVELLEEYYVDELPAAVYEAETLEEVFAALGDPYTYYMTAEEHDRFNASVEDTTTLVGVGVAIVYEETGLRITQIVNGGSAEAAGLVAGDTIIAVDGVSCVPGTEDAAGLIGGEEGTQVTLSIRHADGTAEDYTMTRTLIVATNTNISLLDGHIGVIECSSFGSETAGLVHAALEGREGEVDLWWMDLRNNSGGLSDAAVESIGLFAGSGIHLYYRDSDGIYYVSGYGGPYITEHPVIVLTNGETASASEIFAAGIRDCAAGISVGGRTFGKGIAQIILDRETAGEYFTDDALKVTSYRIFSTNGNTTDRIGIIPTLLVDADEADEVARLLESAAPADSQNWLKLGLGGWAWYVDLNKAESGEWAAVFNALLEALPPDAYAALGTGGGDWVDVTVGTALLLCGSETTECRWFTDVYGSPYANELNTLATYDILRGSGDGTFDPQGTLTRAGLCAMLAQALGLESGSGSCFIDVPDGSWYASSVMAVYELGLMKGDGEGRFNPQEPVTNEALVAVMGRLGAFLNCNLYDKTAAYEDSPLNVGPLAAYADWAREGACLMLYLQELWADGSAAVLYDDLENVDPGAQVTREQAGATLCRLLWNTGILTY